MKPLKDIEAHPRLHAVQYSEDGGTGIFVASTGAKLRVVWATGGGWDHVSVSHKSRTPRYQEMKAVKRAFFERFEWAIEYHPPASDYVSIYDNVLHLWRPQHQPIPTPPKEMV